LQYILLQITEM